MTLYRRQGSKLPPRKRNAKKAKGLSEEALQIAVNRRNVKDKGEKKKKIYIYIYTHTHIYIHSFECRVPKNSKER